MILLGNLQLQGIHPELCCVCCISIGKANPERRISSMARIAAGENVERKAEAGPPYRDTRVLNQEVMNEIENSVSDKRSRSQPQILPEADHRHAPETLSAASDSTRAPAWIRPWPQTRYNTWATTSSTVG